MSESSLAQVYPVLLTGRERRVIARALNVTAAMMDALDEPGAVDVLALAERVCPEEDDLG